MITVKIYQFPKNAMQSGKRKTKTWCVGFESSDPLLPDPLMGWTSSQDMSQELHFIFPSLMKALQFAKANGYEYSVYTPSKSLPFPQSYETNFTCPRIRGS